ncbi:hypothetical protein RJ641_017909 [Dillenia turbinata]|uniref:Uncharacterized protein n=1 Tax=Dillenia turbinata TaxID=194707 RepID=A0AAN8UWG9_9MAGN
MRLKSAMRQLDMEKLIEKALKDGSLDEREVTPFMRVRVVGLTAKISHGKYHAGEALITIWDLTQKQQSELVEGKAYAVSGLTPLNSGSSTLHLQARGSAIKWQPLSPSKVDHFK